MLRTFSIKKCSSLLSGKQLGFSRFRLLVPKFPLQCASHSFTTGIDSHASADFGSHTDWHSFDTDTSTVSDAPLQATKRFNSKDSANDGAHKRMRRKPKADVYFWSKEQIAKMDVTSCEQRIGKLLRQYHNRILNPEYRSGSFAKDSERIRKEVWKMLFRLSVLHCHRFQLRGSNASKKRKQNTDFDDTAIDGFNTAKSAGNSASILTETKYGSEIVLLLTAAMKKCWAEYNDIHSVLYIHKLAVDYSVSNCSSAQQSEDCGELDSSDSMSSMAVRRSGTLKTPALLGGHSLDSVFFNTVLNACCESFRQTDALNVFKDMREMDERRLMRYERELKRLQKASGKKRKKRKSESGSEWEEKQTAESSESSDSRTIIDSLSEPLLAAPMPLVTQHTFGTLLKGCKLQCKSVATKVTRNSGGSMDEELNSFRQFALNCKNGSSTVVPTEVSQMHGAFLKVLKTSSPMGLTMKMRNALVFHTLMASAPLQSTDSAEMSQPLTTSESESGQHLNSMSDTFLTGHSSEKKFEAKSNESALLEAVRLVSATGVNAEGEEADIETMAKELLLEDDCSASDSLSVPMQLTKELLLNAEEIDSKETALIEVDSLQETALFIFASMLESPFAIAPNEVVYASILQIFTVKGTLESDGWRLREGVDILNRFIDSRSDLCLNESLLIAAIQFFSSFRRCNLELLSPTTDSTDAILVESETVASKYLAEIYNKIFTTVRNSESASASPLAISANDTETVRTIQLTDDKSVSDGRGIENWTDDGVVSSSETPALVLSQMSYKQLARFRKQLTFGVFSGRLKSEMRVRNSMAIALAKAWRFEEAHEVFDTLVSLSKRQKERKTHWKRTFSDELKRAAADSWKRLPFVIGIKCNILLTEMESLLYSLRKDTAVAAGSGRLKEELQQRNEELWKEYRKYMAMIETDNCDDYLKRLYTHALMVFATNKFYGDTSAFHFNSDTVTGLHGTNATTVALSESETDKGMEEKSWLPFVLKALDEFHSRFKPGFYLKRKGSERIVTLDFKRMNAESAAVLLLHRLRHKKTQNLTELVAFFGSEYTARFVTKILAVYEPRATVQATVRHFNRRPDVTLRVKMPYRATDYGKEKVAVDTVDASVLRGVSDLSAPW